MRIALGSDHGGFEIKEVIRENLTRRGLEVEDLGTYSKDPVDYPDFAREVASRVSMKQVDQGILVCTSGIGMSIVSNKFAGVRAALCYTPTLASMARAHNDANVLVIGGGYVDGLQAIAIVDAWLDGEFDKAERHARRIRKIENYSLDALQGAAVLKTDPEIYAAIQNERRRQQSTINLIASENYVTAAVRDASGCVMTNKYAEGYPGRRYYNGCEYVDAAELLAIQRAKKLFEADHANVQPHCGSSANMAVYFAMLNPGDTIMAMSLACGGHLTHGHAVNFSGRFFKIAPYGVDPKTEQIDYDELMKIAIESKPKIIVAGASAYPRALDFAKFREIADKVGAYLMVDMAHIAGLVAGHVHANPVLFADFVTTTTHKTLRGPRSGMILCRKDYAAAIDKQVFPGIQGGPEMHTIAAKAVCFQEALQPGFQTYARQIVANCRELAGCLTRAGLRLVSGGSDNHLMLLDVSSIGLTGRDAATALDHARIIVNKNAIPFDKNPPAVTSGIRIGTAACTTRGMQEPEMQLIAELIVDVLQDVKDEKRQKRAAERVLKLTAKHPTP